MRELREIEIEFRSDPELVGRLGAIPQDATDEERRAIVAGAIEEFGLEQVVLYRDDLSWAIAATELDGADLIRVVPPEDDGEGGE